MKLKSSLLYLILENHEQEKRYSKSFNNLKNVIMLEKEEDNFDLGEEIKTSFEKLSEKYNDFFNSIPLEVVELFYYKNREDLNKYVCVRYKDKDFTITVIDLYIMLEEFFKEVYCIAVKIANLYNLEVKINSNNSSDENII